MGAKEELQGKSTEEICSGIINPGGDDYVYSLSVYFRKAVQVYDPGTLFCARPYTFGERYEQRFPYRIRKTTITEFIGSLKQKMRERNCRYLELFHGEYSFYYDFKDDRFFSERGSWHFKNFHSVDVWTPECGIKAAVWHIISADGEAVRFSMERALTMMQQDANSAKALYNFEHAYIYQTEHKKPAGSIPKLECYAKKPSISINGETKGEETWFSLIECEVYLTSQYANIEYLKGHAEEIYKDLLKRIQATPRFIKADIPIGFLKIGNAALMNDGVFRVVFQLKSETEDDIGDGI